MEDLTDTDWSYFVAPSAGWTDAGYFEVSYSAYPSQQVGASNWVAPQYYGQTKPDFTFTLKNRINQVPYPNQYYTTDIYSDPPLPVVGQPVTLTAQGGFASAVSLSSSIAPSLTGSRSLGRKSLTPPGSTTLRVSVGSRAKRGTYTVTVKGASGGLTRTATATLVVP